FLYRELVDAITPWIAQQTSEQFRPGIFFTLSLATFGWVGIRGMTWFLFGQYGTPIVLAFISRQPMETGGRGLSEVPSVVVRWWRAPLDDFKTEIEWLHEKATELVEYLTLPVLHVVGAALNFAMILLMSKPVFNLPFKSLNEPKSFQPIHNFQGKSIAQIEADLRKLFTPNDTYTEFNPFFQEVARITKERNLVLAPITLMLVTDGVPDSNMPGVKGGARVLYEKIN